MLHLNTVKNDFFLFPKDIEIGQARKLRTLMTKYNLCCSLDVWLFFLFMNLTYLAFLRYVMFGCFYVFIHNV